MNLRENIRRILKEEVNSVDVKTIQSELTNLLGSSNIKNGNRVEFVRIGPFNSSFDIVVDRLDQNTLNYLNKFMSEKGWFPTNISLSGMKGRIYSNHVNEYMGEDDVQIGYESNFAKEVNTTQTKAFHVTPDIFIDKIKKTGLTLKSESKLSNHPDRIYLFLNQDEDGSKNMVWAIWNSLSKERQNQIKDYYVLEIDLTKLPNHKFYHDPQSMGTYEAIYTNQAIPRSAIKVIDKINTSDIETKDDDVVMSKDEERRAREEKRRKKEEALKQKKEFDANLSTQMQTSKEFNKLPDDIKNMNIDDLFNLEESIRRGIKEMMGNVNESITGITPTDTTQQFINKPVKLIGDVNTTTKIRNINVNNDGSVNILFQNGMKVNSSLPMLRKFNLEVDIPLEFKVRKKGNINESETKKPKLLSIIEENGLYNVMSSSGLHINQIEQKVGQLSKEVLERFIIDVVKEHFNAIDDDGKTYIIYLEDHPFDVVPIGNNDWVEQLTVTNNELLFLVTLYEEDEYGDLEFSGEELTPSKNLKYNNIYEIAGQLGYYLVRGQF